jgi:hypothetical protein
MRLRLIFLYSRDRNSGGSKQKFTEFDRIRDTQHNCRPVGCFCTDDSLSETYADKIQCGRDVKPVAKEAGYLLSLIGFQIALLLGHENSTPLTCYAPLFGGTIPPP